MKPGILQYLEDIVTENQLRRFNKNINNLIRQEKGIEAFRLIKL